MGKWHRGNFLHPNAGGAPLCSCRSCGEIMRDSTDCDCRSFVGVPDVRQRLRCQASGQPLASGFVHDVMCLCLLSASYSLVAVPSTSPASGILPLAVVEVFLQKMISPSRVSLARAAKQPADQRTPSESLPARHSRGLKK